MRFVVEPDFAGPDYAGLIRPDRVHGSLYTDPRVFADELAVGKEIFAELVAQEAAHVFIAGLDAEAGCLGDEQLLQDEALAGLLLSFFDEA